MFLSALYTIFAILLFLYYGSEGEMDDEDDDDVGANHVNVQHVNVVPKPLTSISSDPRRENFITMGNT
jgi:hypothetical protein